MHLFSLFLESRFKQEFAPPLIPWTFQGRNSGI